MSHRSVCQEIKRKLPPERKLLAPIINSNSLEFRSIEEIMPDLRDYGPVMRASLENISSGESSPCHSDNEKLPSRPPKRKKDLSLYNILTNYLDSSTVEELKPYSQNTSQFDWVIVMGFINDLQVTRAKEILASTDCKKKVRFAKRVYYKGFRSCLFECKSFEDGVYLLNVVRSNLLASKGIQANLWGLQVKSKFKDPEFQSTYNAVIVKNVPPNFTQDTFKHFLNSEFPHVPIKTVDVMTFIENTIATIITLPSLEEAEIICQALNNRSFPNNYILKVALVMKPGLKHRNKENSIFKEYLIEPRKMMLEKLMNSRLFRYDNPQENEHASKKTDVKGLLELFGQKPMQQTSSIEANLMKTENRICPNIAMDNPNPVTWQPNLGQIPQFPGMFPPQQIPIDYQSAVYSQYPNNIPYMPQFGLPLNSNMPDLPKNDISIKEGQNTNKVDPQIQNLGFGYGYNGYMLPDYSYYPYPQMMPMGFSYGIPPNLQGTIAMNYFYQNSGFPDMSVPPKTTLEQNSKEPDIQSSELPFNSESETVRKKVFSEGGQTYINLRKYPPSSTKESIKKM